MTEEARLKRLADRFPSCACVECRGEPNSIIDELFLDGLTLGEIEGMITEEPARSPIHRVMPRGVEFVEFNPIDETAIEPMGPRRVPPDLAKGRSA